MSFHTVKIVGKFSKKITFKKKKSVPKKNISIKISKTQPISTKLSKPISDSNIILDKIFKPFNTQVDIDSNNHFIGLIIVNCISVNEIHNLKWNKNDKIYLNITRICTIKNNEYPILKIPNSEYIPGFKFKKYIKLFLKSKLLIKKKNLHSIKLLGNYGNLHNYIIILNNAKCILKLKKHNEKILWRNVFDQYHIQNEFIEPDQHEIYKQVINKRSISNINYNFNLHPYLENCSEPYLSQCTIDYRLILKFLYNQEFN
jgi:hypothetical protein